MYLWGPCPEQQEPSEQSLFSKYLFQSAPIYLTKGHQTIGQHILVLDTIHVYQLTSRSHPSSRERRSPVSVMNMYRSIMVLRAVTWFLLAGFCLEFFALALPLAASDYSRNLLAWNKTRRHSLDSSLVARVPQILTASDIGKRDIAEDRLIYDEAYRKMKNCYQDFQVNSLSLCMLQSLGKGFIWLCPS